MAMLLMADFQSSKDNTPASPGILVSNTVHGSL